MFNKGLFKKIGIYIVMLFTIPVAFAAVDLVEDVVNPTPPGLVLKAEIALIVHDQLIDEVIGFGRDEVKTGAKIVQYFYQEEMGILPDEIISKRTRNTRYFTVREENQVRMKVSLGIPFEEKDGVWMRTKSATTTINAFNDQRSIGLASVINKAHAVTVAEIIGASLDDAYSSAIDTTGFDGTSIGVRVGSDFANGDKAIVAGFRFQTVAIPANSTINTATLTLNSEATSNEAILLNIHMEASDDCITFADDATGRPGQRATTTAFTVFDQPGTWINDVDQVSDSIVTAVQEVVDRGGWATGQDMCVLVVDDGTTPVGNNKNATSYDGNTAEVAELDITYTLAVPTTITAISTAVTDTTATLNGEVTNTASETNFAIGFETGIDAFTSGAFTATTTTETATSSIGVYSSAITGLTTFQEYGNRTYASTTEGLYAFGNTFRFFTGDISTSTQRVSSDNHTHDLSDWDHGTHATTTDNAGVLELSGSGGGGGIAFRDSVSDSTDNGGDAVLDLTGLTGLAEDDIVIIAYVIGDNDNVDFDMAVSSGTGWTEIVDLHQDDSNDVDLGVYYKIMGATVDTTVSLSGLGGADTDTIAVAMAFSGVDTTTPIDVTTTTDQGGNTADANSPSIDHNGTAGTAILSIAASGHDHTNTATYTAPTGYDTNLVQISASDGTDGTVAIGYDLSVSDPEDPGAFNLSSDSIDNSWIGATVALRPALGYTDEGYWISKAWDVGSIDLVDDSWLEIASTTAGNSSLEVAIGLNTSATVPPSIATGFSTTTNLSAMTGVTGDLTGKFLWTLVWMKPTSGNDGTPSVTEIIWAINKGVATPGSRRIIIGN